MSTTCTRPIGTFRFTINGKLGDKYEMQIEQLQPWGEVVIANGMLMLENNDWILEDMTFENAHRCGVLRSFLYDLWMVSTMAYPDVVKYYEANNKLNAGQIAWDHFKKAI